MENIDKVTQDQAKIHEMMGCRPHDDEFVPASTPPPRARPHLDEKRRARSVNCCIFPLWCGYYVVGRGCNTQAASRASARVHLHCALRILLGWALLLFCRFGIGNTTKSVSREIERRVGTKTATFWARNRLNLRSTGIEYMYNANYMYCSS